MSETLRNLFEPVRSVRLHDEVVDQIKRLIDSGEIRPGDRLPSERDLALRMDVSRNVLREALRALEARGLIITHHGVGRVVRPLERNVATASHSDALEIATIDEVLETRELIESAAAGLASERHNDDDRTRLLRTARLRGTWTANRDFHLAVASATHNYMLETVIQDQLDLLFELHQRERYGAPRDAEYLLDDHLAIADAILARDSESARELMAEHLRSTRNRVSKPTPPASEA